AAATLPTTIQAAIEAALVARGVPPGTPIYAPLAAGRHVDHQVTFAVALRFRQADWPVWFYEDYPYAARPGTLMERIAALTDAVAPASVIPEVRDIAPYLDTKIAAIAAYPSQISSL